MLVGRIVPSSEKWERIITAGGGKVAITSSRLSMETRSLIEGDEGEGGLRLCVLPDHFPKNRLVEFATQWGYACVSSQYVGNKQPESHIATRPAKQGAEPRYNELPSPILCLLIYYCIRAFTSLYWSTDIHEGRNEGSTHKWTLKSSTNTISYTRIFFSKWENLGMEKAGYALHHDGRHRPLLEPTNASHQDPRVVLQWYSTNSITCPFRQLIRIG